MLDELITTPRLRLPLITPAEAAMMRTGRRDPSWHPDYPREDDLDAVGMATGGDPWGPRHIVRAFDGVVFGSIGFFGPPEPVGEGSERQEVEVGFGLVPDGRGRGVATEALQAMVAQAEGQGVGVRARVLPENTASLRVLAKCGFTSLRGSDEEGHLVMARPDPR